MGFFGGKKAEPPDLELAVSQFAFVLLREVELPAAEDILSAFEQFRTESEVLTYEPDEGTSDEELGDGETLALRLEGMGFAFVALVPVPVPNGEAEHAFGCSMSSFEDGVTLEAHAAHRVVSLVGLDQAVSLVAGQMAFTSVLAAVTKVSPAVGVYMGDAGATHTAEFVTEAAGEHNVNSRIMLWNGLSRGPEPDGQMSFLSLGMHQLVLPNLYLIASVDQASESLGRFFELLAYVADRGEPIPDGDTIGATADERLKVNYTASPAGDGSVVWRVRL
ncbi:DUF4261 domain-containing protein [bacterium]|nr:DUF4261 domain-containing protein [bacterium]